MRTHEFLSGFRRNKNKASISDMPLLLPLPDHWNRHLKTIYFAFQPLVARDGKTIFGVEALLRGYERAGFKTIKSFFDEAFEDNVLHALDVSLRFKAILQWRSIFGTSNCRLFYNLDTRCVNGDTYEPGQTAAMLKYYNLETGRVYLELSEQHEILPRKQIDLLLKSYRSQGYLLALDDYGVGFAGLRTLFLTKPEIIKVDRFFIDGIDQDERKQQFMKHLTVFAHDNDIKVVAEGVETAGEIKMCLSLGADYLQGYAILRPTPNWDGKIKVDSNSKQAFMCL